MFSQFECDSFTSEATVWGFQLSGTWQNLQVTACENLEEDLRKEGARSSSCQPYRKGSWRALGITETSAKSLHWTSLNPVFHTHYSQVQESQDWGLEKERKHIIITVIQPDTFSASRPGSSPSPPSNFFLAGCVFWMAFPGVCCVNVRGNVTWWLHPGGWHWLSLALTPPLFL